MVDTYVVYNASKAEDLAFSRFDFEADMNCVICPTFLSFDTWTGDEEGG